MKIPKMLVLRTARERGFPGKKVVNFKLKKGKKALKDTYTSDAHCVAYISREVKEMPRLKIVGLETWPHAVEKVWCLIDVDNPGHGEWTEELKKEVAKKLKKLPEFKHAGFYYTRGGYRLVWPLKKPIDVRYAAHWQQQFQAYVSKTCGIECDEATLDWTRLYRLPFVVRDGVNQELFSDFSNMDFLDWEAPNKLEMSKQRSLGNFDINNKAPAITEIPDVKEYDLLQDCSYYNALVDGVALAEKGGRNSATMKCLGYIVNLYGFTKPEDPYRLMYHSVEYQMNNGSPKSDLNWFWGRCQAICSQQQAEGEKYEDIDPQYLNRPKDKKKKELKEIKKEKLRLEKLSKTEKILEYMGLEDEEDIHHHLIFIEPGGQKFRVFNEYECEYGPSVKQNRIFQQLISNCSTWAGRVANTNGKAPDMSELLRRYSRNEGKETQWIYGDKGIKYEPNDKLIKEGICCPREGLYPEKNLEIEKWLDLIGGDKKEFFKDWLATCLDVQHPTCALYIKGPHSIGKGLLAEGLGELWGTALTRYSAVAGSNWNSSLLKCPIVLLDEGVADNKMGNASDYFRQLIGTTRHELRVRYLSEQVLIGCPRVLVTANNIDALAISDRLTAEDLDALKIRIGYIEVKDLGDKTPAAVYLRELGGRKYTDAWVRGQGIARHILWLNKNRKVQPGSRFLVHGWKSKLTDNLAIMTPSTAKVVSAICNLIMSPELKRNATGFQVGGGKIFVSIRALTSLWEHLVPSDFKPPTENHIKDSLNVIKLSKGRKKIKGSYPRGWNIDPKFIYSMSAKNITYTHKELKAVINKPILKVVEALEGNVKVKKLKKKKKKGGKKNG